jgi:hypothetical protein
VPQPDIDLKAEVARVQQEMAFFRRECLPVFLGGPVQDFLSDGMSEHLKGHIVAVAGRLSEWRDAAMRLAEYLPLGPLPAEALSLNHQDFSRFRFQPATPAFAVRGGRIVWRIELFMPVEAALDCPIFAGQADDGSDPWDRFRRRAEAVKKWLLGLPMDQGGHLDALCVIPPFLADIDPSFVRLAMDRDTWLAIARSAPGLSEEQREKRLDFLGGNWFAHVLNNALLHVLGGLANNHFLAIRDYLDHPQLRGSYTHLMPHYLFAVLFEKVGALRRLSQERPGLWGSQGPTGAAAGRT